MNLLTNLNQLLYIDPAATSVLLTSITAIVVALGASAIVIWRKLKKNVKKALKIDENTGKEVEEDLVITEDTANAEEVKEESAVTKEKIEEDK